MIVITFILFRDFWKCLWHTKLKNYVEKVYTIKHGLIAVDF